MKAKKIKDQFPEHPIWKEMGAIRKKTIKDWSGITSAYIMTTAQVELFLNEAISLFFLKLPKEQDMLIEFVIIDMGFNKKIQILKNLLNTKQYRKLFTKHIESILNTIGKIYVKRSRLAHSVPVIIKPYNKNRVTYQNLSRSFSQNIIITKKEAKDDETFLYGAMLSLDILKRQIATIKNAGSP
jgi:hypothetical protein